MSGRALVAGCGFVGEAAADLLHARGWEVIGWTASEASAARLSREKPYPVSAQDILGDLPGVSPAVVVDCVSSGRGGAETYRRVYLEGARALRAAYPGARLIFTSSTSVYAQTDGAWVDEASAAEPERETGRLLRETEELVLASPGGAVLRLAGLYGPGRGTLVGKARAGAAPVEGDGRRWMNFCHRDDAAAAIALAAERELRGVFNVADDCPVQQGDCVRALAGLFGHPPPDTVAPELDRKRGWTSKRVSNARLRSLGWRPAHPSFLREAEGTIA